MTISSTWPSQPAGKCKVSLFCKTGHGYTGFWSLSSPPFSELPTRVQRPGLPPATPTRRTPQSRAILGSEQQRRAGLEWFEAFPPFPSVVLLWWWSCGSKVGWWWLRNRIQDWEWRRPTGRIQKPCLGVGTGWLSSPGGPTTHLF